VNNPPQINDSIQLWVNATNLTNNMTNIINVLQQYKSVSGTLLSWSSLDKTVYRTMSISSIVAVSGNYQLNGTVKSTSATSFTGTEPLVVFSVLGNVDGASNNALMNQPTNITFDLNNNIWISDTGNSSIRSIATKVVSTLSTLTNAPIGISIDSFLNVYAASSTNIVQITPSGIKTNIYTGTATLGNLSLQSLSDVSPYQFINGWPSAVGWVIAGGGYYPPMFTPKGFVPILLPYVPNILFDITFNYTAPSALYIQLMITSTSGTLPGVTSGNYNNYVAISNTGVTFLLGAVTIFTVLYSDIKELNND
jgi:hypothetical protein